MADRMSGEELSRLARQAEKPLELTIRWVEAGLAPELAAPVLLTGFQAAPSCDAPGFKLVTRFARFFHQTNPGAEAALLEALTLAPGVAARIYCAAYAEELKDYGRAAEVYEAAADDCAEDGRVLCLVAGAKNRGRRQEWAVAWRAVIEAAKRAEAYSAVDAVGRIIRELSRASKPPAKRTCRIAVAGSTALELVAPLLRVALLGREIDAEIHVGGYGTFEQDIRDPGSALAAFRPDVVIIAPDWRALGLPEESDGPEETIQAKVAGLAELWTICRERLGAFVIQHNFEVPVESAYGRLSALLPGGRARLLRAINHALVPAASQAGIALLDIEQIAASFGKDRWHDPALWQVAKQYPANEAVSRLLRHQAALVAALFGLSKKCVVLDLDGTLWGGVVGEDGVDQLKLGGTDTGESFVAFQHYLLNLKRRGILLCVCSKNNEADARLPFETHPEMVLKLEDLALFVANWKSKAENLRNIAKTLNIGADSLVFVDDNPLERLLVRREAPEIEVVDLPIDPALYVRALDRGLFFESLAFSDEDRERSRSYRQNALREELRSQSGSVDDYLASLGMKVELRPFDSQNLPRVTQLINKTNQFNLTTHRLTEAQVDALAADPAVYTQAMRLRDKFGDSGLTGVMVGVPEGADLRIDLWLVSCRVLGRRIEDLMLRAVLDFARAGGVRRVVGEYLPTSKNVQVADLYDRFGFTLDSTAPGGAKRYHWDITSPLPPSPDYISVSDTTRADVLATTGK